MKKPFNYREVNTLKRCIDCNMPLKKNLLAKNPNAKRCNVCHHLNSKSLGFPIELYKEIQCKRRVTYNWSPSSKI